MRRLLCYQFQLAYRLNLWLRHHLTQAGYWVLAGMLLAIMTGINTRLTLGSQIFSFLALALLIDALFALRFRPQLRISRVLPMFTSQGETVRYHFVVENLHPEQQIGITLEDDFGKRYPGYQNFLQFRDPLDRTRNWFDRKMGYPKWLALVKQKRNADLHSSEPVALLGNSKTTIATSLYATRRGLIQFEGYLLKRPGPLGLFNAIYRVPDQGQLLVLPVRYTMPPFSLSGRAALQSAGATAKASGLGNEEFFALRDYHYGDAKRDIHWKSWAKAGKPVVREYRPERLLRHGLILDTSVAASQHTAFEVAVSLTASLLLSLETRESLLDLIYIGTQSYQFTVGFGFNHSQHVLKVLATVKQSPPESILALKAKLLAQAGQLSGCVLILSCWDAEREQLVQQLLRSRIELHVLLVSADTLAGPDGVTRIDPAAPERSLAGLLR